MTNEEYKYKLELRHSKFHIPKGGDSLKMKLRCLLTATILCAFPFSSAIASEGLNSGDTAWIIVSTALVMMMTPAGLALFYGGMSRSKNLLNTFAMTFACITVALVLGSIVDRMKFSSWNVRGLGRLSDSTFCQSGNQ